jgi:hypothetical protein
MKTQTNQNQLEGMNRRLAAYSAAAGTVCALAAHASADTVLLDNGGAGWTATLSNPSNPDNFLTLGFGGAVAGSNLVVNLPDPGGDPVTTTTGAQFAIEFLPLSGSVPQFYVNDLTSPSVNTIAKNTSSTAPTTVDSSTMKWDGNEYAGGSTEYLPVDFIGGDGNHYGWMEITQLTANTLTLNALEFETNPNVQFTSIPTPEPGTGALAAVSLLVFGAGGLAKLRRRQQGQV